MKLAGSQSRYLSELLSDKRGGGAVGLFTLPLDALVIMMFGADRSDSKKSVSSSVGHRN